MPPSSSARRLVRRPPISLGTLLGAAALCVALIGTLLATGVAADAASLISGKRIQNKSITGSKLRDGTISTTKLSATAIAALKGATGPAGAPGATGPAGPTGARGEQGIPGTAAAKGEKGDTGPQGPQGPQGPAGSGASVADGSVSTAKLADLAVTAAKIANFSVTSDKIDQGAVGQSQLAGGAVGTPELQSSAVTADKLAGGAVGPQELQADAVSGANIQAGAVDTADLSDGAVTSAKIGGTLSADQVARLNYSRSVAFAQVPAQGCVYSDDVEAIGFSFDQASVVLTPDYLTTSNVVTYTPEYRSSGGLKIKACNGTTNAVPPRSVTFRITAFK